MELQQSIVHEILNTLEELAEKGGGKTVRDLIADRIEAYVDLVQMVEGLQSPVDVLRLKGDLAFQLQYGSEIQMNDHIQTVLFFGERGLIDVQNIPEDSEAHVTHPGVQLLGTVNPECFIMDLPDADENTTEEVAAEVFDELADRIITSLAVRHVLGNFNFWVDPNIVCPTTYLSVHSLSSTVH